MPAHPGQGAGVNGAGCLADHWCEPAAIRQEPQGAGVLTRPTAGAHLLDDLLRAADFLREAELRDLEVLLPDFLVDRAAPLADFLPVPDLPLDLLAVERFVPGMETPLWNSWKTQAAVHFGA